MRHLTSRLNTLLKRSERGQTLIFVAVMGATLMGVMGLAVLGGHVFVEYRRMQSAADMAAIVGAQDLPCGLSDTTCINKAEKSACNYAQTNGYGGGWQSSVNGGSCATATKSTGLSDSTITTTASVPPTSCSPYDFLDYGNNSSCPGRNPSTLQQYTFIEVQIQEPVTVPVFNISFTLVAHAVAKEGVSTPSDFTVSVLDPNANPAFTMGGSTNTVVVGDTMANGSISINGTGGNEVSCDGSWFTGASQSVPANSSFVSNLSGAPSFAPASCTGGTNLNPASFFPNSPLIPDPYGDTQPPSSTNMPNCSDCERTAYYYQWNGSRSSGTWYQATSGITISGSTNLELFPGVYNGGITAHGGHIYVNPGVYTFQGNFDANSGTTMCIYGAPACDEVGTNIPTLGFACAHAAFSGGVNLISSDQWYYYCSPWGVWDTKLDRSGAAGLGGGPSTTPPTFYDPRTGSNLPLNGVTFYMQTGNFTMNGHADMYMAFPNACPGTATSGFSSPGIANIPLGTVPFSGNPVGEPSGYKDAYYTYPVTSLAYSDGLRKSTDVAVSGTDTQVYPNADLTLDGECKDGLFVWQGEFPGKPDSQHLHFLVFADNTTSNFSLNGSAVEDWWGIWHTFPQNYPGYPGPPTADCPNGNCNITLNGNGGSAGVPMLEGQIVTGTATFTGNGSAEIFYRPCRALKTPCGTGPGTALVQ